MKFGALFLIATSFTALAASEDQLNRHFAAQPGGELVVSIDFGSVAVNTNSTNGVVVDVHRKVRLSTKDAEEKFLRNAPVEVTQEGNKILVRCHSKNKGASFSGWSFWKGRSLEAEYTVSVPAQFNARVETSGGSIKVRGVSGDVNVQTSGGSLEFSGVRGPVNGGTSGGSIHAQDCQGALKLNTSGGSIQVLGGGGSIDGHTSGGSTTVKNFQGPADLTTSGGSMTFENVAGRIDGSTSGGTIRAVLVAPLPGAVQLGTSGGSVNVSSPGTASFHLDAETSAGGISNELPMTTVDNKGDGHLRGAINGGGESVRLRTSGGSIHIRKI